MTEIWPLKTVREVNEWDGDHVAPWWLATVPLVRSKANPKGGPKTLICHDLKGGYLQDRFTQGQSSTDVYRFVHWPLVDIFVYFSHHFVTIPPPCWIDAAHLHNVPVLGTLITEWETGAKMCQEVLASEKNREAFATKLVQIAVRFRFDGWLVNIENQIQKDKVDGMVSLVKSLTDKMHAAVPGSTVIWYDSVTCRGDLTWQNELNTNNRCFFDVCDAIFLNYTWNLENLERSATLAGDRKCDVYVGIDVFGRGSFGGGRFNCSMAMKAIRENNLSAAIFAPAWTWEDLLDQPIRDFVANDYRFWGYLTKFCREDATPSAVPFATSFCQGVGHRVFRRGHTISKDSWCNLSLQQVQPCYLTEWYREGLQYSFVPYMEDGYDGGGCVRIVGSNSIPNIPPIRLWKCEWKTEGRQRALVAFTWKSRKPSEDARVALRIKAVRGDVSRTLVLLNEEEVQGPQLDVPGEVLYPVNQETRERLASRGVHVPEKHENGWQTKLFVLPPGLEMTEMSVEVLSESNDGFDILIGQIKVALLSKLKNRRSRDHIKVKCQQMREGVSVTHQLEWRCSRNDHDAIFDVFCSEQYLGSTRRRCFQVALDDVIEGEVKYWVVERSVWYSDDLKGSTTLCPEISTILSE